MKKFAAVALVLTFTLCVFAACGQKGIEGGEVVTDGAGHEYPVATQEGGGYIRNEDGNVVILATDANGDSYTDSNGENITTQVNLHNALVIGNLIEFERYYIELPDGWSNSGSFSDMIFKKDGTDDQIWVAERSASDTDIKELIQNSNKMISAVTAKYADAKTDTKSIMIGENKCPFYAVYVPDTGDGQASYFSQAHFDNGGYLYTFTITSTRDLSGDLDEISEILSTITFK